MKTPAKILTGLLLGATMLAAVPVLAQNTTPPAPPAAVEDGMPGPGASPDASPDDSASANDGWGWWGHGKGHGKGRHGGHADGGGDCGERGGNDQAGWGGHGGGHGRGHGDGQGRGWWGRGGDDGQMGERGPMRMMRLIDDNGDGVIGDDEAASRVENVFNAMDADSSGDITEAEFMAVRMGPGEGRNKDRQAERQAMMQERKKARFAEMDADKDGKVTKAQFLAAGKARFAAADSDKDGKVTPLEFRGQHMN